MTRQYNRATTAPVDMPPSSATQEAMNPGNNLEQRQEKFAERRKRVSMATASRKLETPELPGYYLHWVSGEPDRIAKAIRAEYTFVQKDELPGYTLELGDQTGIAGSGDMGNAISVIAGGAANDGQALRLYLMKLPSELRAEDMRVRDEEGQKVIDTLYNNPNAQAGNGQDNERRYSEFDMKTETRGPRQKKPQSQSYNVLDTFRKR
jgi:hypothetical protein